MQKVLQEFQLNKPLPYTPPLCDIMKIDLAHLQQVDNSGVEYTLFRPSLLSVPFWLSLHSLILSQPIYRSLLYFWALNPPLNQTYWLYISVLVLQLQTFTTYGLTWERIGFSFRLFPSTQQI